VLAPDVRIEKRIARVQMKRMGRRVMAISRILTLLLGKDQGLWIYRHRAKAIE